MGEMERYGKRWMERERESGSVGGEAERYT